MSEQESVMDNTLIFLIPTHQPKETISHLAGTAQASLLLKVKRSSLS
jgi:hypothetical protein